MEQIKGDEIGNDDYDATASDVAQLFKISQGAVWRLAREKKLPEGAYTYVNQRTVRFNLDRCRKWAAKGGARQ